MSNWKDESSILMERRFNSNGITRCNDCSLYIPSYSLDEHNALKHSNKQENVENLVYKTRECVRPESSNVIAQNPSHELSLNANDSVVDRIDSSVKSIPIQKEFRYGKENQISSVWANGRYASIESSKNEMSSRKNLLPRDARPLIRKSNTKKKLRSSSQMHSNEMFGIRDLSLDGAQGRPKKPLCDLSANGAQSRPKKPLRDLSLDGAQSRPSKPLRDLSSDGAQSRPKIPSVFELFNQNPNTSVSKDSDKFHPEADHKNRRSSSASKKPGIPEDYVKCQFCLNFMHPHHLEGHIQRKHAVGEQVRARLYRSKICENLMAAGHIAADANRAHQNVDTKQNNKDNFIRCTQCNSKMHIDSMPHHMLCKHNAYEGSIGIVWHRKRNDDEINQWFKDGMVFVKDGELYIKPRND